MSEYWSLQDAEKNFEKIASATSDGSVQVISKNDQPYVVIMSIDTYKDLTEASFSKFLADLERYKIESPEKYSSINNYLLAMPQMSDDTEIC